MTQGGDVGLRYRVGIDVGGTFTDFVVANRVTGRLAFHKEPSVPSDPSLAVERGLDALVAAGSLHTDAIELMVHGTTLGLNAIIQRRGARLALVVSRGNRDLFEIARLRLPSSYDFTVPREAPLVPRSLVFEVSARGRSDGSVDTPLDPAEVATLAETLRTARVEAVAIVLLNSYRDPALEEALAGALRALLPDVLVTGSAAIWPEIREYERGLVAGLNASIHPLMSRYFERLTRRVASRGITAPIFITANNGGSLSLETAAARPIDTVLSGPASGVIASLAVGAAADVAKLITFDMGGTSADIAICQTGTPEFSTATFVGDFPLMLPVVNVGAIGAGGGSIVWVDDQGLLKVGPLSAGADPGPACYGRGGTQPTLTDCYLVLGIVDPLRFVGGRMRLDVEAARASLERVATALGVAGAVAVAIAAVRVASARMASEITKLLAVAGVDPREFALVAYGGAGPTHAGFLADEAGLDTILVPAAPGTFCALGAILADVRRDYVRTARHRVGAVTLSGDGWPALARILDELEAQARAWIAAEATIIGACETIVAFDLRYVAQAYELAVTVPAERRASLDGATLAALFHAEHERIYGFHEVATAVETATVRLSVVGRVPPLSLPTVEPGVARPIGARAVTLREAARRADVYARADLGEGARFQGPAIVEQDDTTTYVPSGWAASVDGVGTLRLTREAAP